MSQSGEKGKVNETYLSSSVFKDAVCKDALTLLMCVC